ncbi:MAG TPA: hypothetical protein PK018_08430 [Candidatus Competibacter sp.]|nr:hypothetical protein [Candidatus Competibacteraceae bacterium]HPE72180.1 hypothetical protein [Candidatus Competibacter sp.]HRW66839.1 hypothetical protein [Candidatus Competibacter sp.]
MKVQAMTASLALALAGYVTETAALEPSAVLRQMQGRVFVGQTTTMGLARDELPLYAGNRVVAVAGSQAEVVYSNGCTVAVPENSLLVIEGPQQCRLDRVRVRTIDGFQDTRIGQAGPLSTVAGSTSPANASPVSLAPASSPPVGAGGEWDARLEQPKGSAFVEERGIRVPAQQNMGVQADTRLITEKDSEVTVVFKGCEVEVGPGERVKVEELRTRCKEGVLDGSKTGKDLVVGLKQPKGDVFVGEGGGRAQVRSKRSALGDDLIVTETGSRVTVVFDGCRTRLGEDERVLVEDLSSLCVAGLWAGTGAAAGMGGTTAAASTGLAAASAGLAAVGTVNATIVAALGAAMVGAAIVEGNNQEARPTSGE